MAVASLLVFTCNTIWLLTSAIPNGSGNYTALESEVSYLSMGIDFLRTTVVDEYTCRSCSTNPVTDVYCCQWISAEHLANSGPRVARMSSALSKPPNILVSCLSQIRELA